ncbi:MAG: DUF4129 domain-containing protein [Pirellulaceae bacterium]
MRQTIVEDPVGAFVASCDHRWRGFSAVTLIVIARRHRSRKTAPLTADEKTPNRDLIIIYEAYVQSLKRFGLTPDPSETDDEILVRLSEIAEPSIVTAASRFVRNYRVARYGDASPNEELSELARL